MMTNRILDRSHDDDDGDHDDWEVVQIQTCLDDIRLLQLHLHGNTHYSWNDTLQTLWNFGFGMN